MDSLIEYLHKRVVRAGKRGKVIQVMGTRLMVEMDEPRFTKYDGKKIELAEFWDVSEVELEVENGD